MSYEVVELYQGFKSYVLKCGSIERKKKTEKIVEKKREKKEEEEKKFRYLCVVDSDL